MIPTYNCAGFLGETLASVLRQDPGPDVMQIEVVDDHSDDDPGAVVARLGQGRIGFSMQPRRVGHIANFATCLQRSRGHLIHLLHGDDYVLDGFYRALGPAFDQVPGLGAAFCRQIFIDEWGRRRSLSRLEQHTSGVLDDWLGRLASEQRIMTPSIAVRRAVYERLGAFDRRLICAEDWEMWVRIAASYPVWYEPEPLAAYRMHTASNTGRHVRAGDDMRYTRVAIELFRNYLPPDRAAAIVRTARSTYGLASLRSAWRLARRGEAVAAANQIREAILFLGPPDIAAAAAVTIVRQSGRQIISATHAARRPAIRWPLHR
jgi:glycosyltransferase involved in cell wall biosynthesis